MNKNNVPIVIYQTDLYHPHNDPDDHFDIATIVSLASQGLINLEEIIIDYPSKDFPGDPAIVAVEQLKYITEIDVPVYIGTSVPMRHLKDTQYDIDSKNSIAVEKIADTLRKAQQPVYIIIVGGCNDVAISGTRYPELFKEKCAGVLLNAGSGRHNEDGILEYNVELNANSYAAIFDLPCPVFWFPCFDKIYNTGGFKPGELGTYYMFEQHQVLGSLSSGMKNYFKYMLEQSNDPKYLRYIDKIVDESFISEYGNMLRNMWSTSSILFAAGKCVNIDGDIIDYNMNGEHNLYILEPISVSCSPEGITDWEYDASSQTRFIFHIKDMDKYNNAMTKVLKDILEEI